MLFFPTTEAPAAAFVCASGDSERSACKLLPFFKEHEGKRYCVLHYPGKEKSAAFDEARKRKLAAEDFNFCGAWFPDAAEFDAITFKDANFNYATFSAEAHFRYARFIGKARFSHATFVEDANFYCSTFGATTNFSSATFRAEANFRYATFVEETNFRHTTFKELVRFSGYEETHVSGDKSSLKGRARFSFLGDEERRVFGDKSSLKLQFARIEKSDLFSFHTVTLRPHWFVNVDARKLEFINVNWNWRNISIKEEIKSLKREDGYGLSAYQLLEIACRNLAVNAEENHRYGEASRFRYMAMDVRRLKWKVRDNLKKTLTRLARSLWHDWGARGRTRTRLKLFLFAYRKGFWKGFIMYWKGFDLLHWLYWVASGYGERVLRASAVLLLLLLLFAGIYTQVGFAQSEPKPPNGSNVVTARRDESGESLRWPRALTYSLGVMTLQKPEPRPATNAAQSLVMLETILGPVQAALLALAIRRKFMR